MRNNDNPDGLASSAATIEIETTPEHMNLVSGDPTCSTWKRTHDDPGVAKLRDHLRANNGIKGLELVSPDDPRRAAELFHRDGFVAIRDALSSDQLTRISKASDEAIELNYSFIGRFADSC